MFTCSDRTWSPCASKPLTSASDLPLVGASGPQPATAVTSREHRTCVRALGCGPKWRTFAVSSHERSHRPLPYLTSREHNKLTPTQAQTVIATAILRQLHAIITTGRAWDPVIAARGTRAHRWPPDPGQRSRKLAAGASPSRH